MIIFVVPAYNEEANIGLLIDDIVAYVQTKGWACRLVVVDDGSRDRTAEIVRKKSETCPCQVVSYQPNQGVHEAFRRGFQTALNLAAAEDVIVSIEADRTGDLRLLDAFIQKINQGTDVVLASYYAEGGRVEGTVWFRRFLSHCANLLIRCCLGMRGIHTYSSFYRAYRPATLRGVLKKHGDFFQEKSFACVLELLFRIHRLGFKIEEVPMILQGANRVGKSKMKVMKTIWGYLRVIRRNVFIHSS